MPKFETKTSRMYILQLNKMPEHLKDKVQIGFNEGSLVANLYPNELDDKIVIKDLKDYLCHLWVEQVLINESVIREETTV
jgi:hypothetical protein